MNDSERTGGEVFLFVLVMVLVALLIAAHGNGTTQYDAARSNAWALERARMAVEADTPDARERVIALWKAAVAESPRSFANQEDSPLARAAKRAAELSGIAPMAGKE